MRKEYESPTVEIIVFKVEDVVTQSTGGEIIPGGGPWDDED